MKYLLRISLLCLIPLQLSVAEPVSVDARGYVAFNQIDSDHNGYVSRVEARSVYGVERAFETADTNQDGLLNSSEYRRARRNAERNE